MQVHPYVQSEWGSAYAAADIIISRAGASSVSELCIVGKPVIFIPSPNVAEDHQTKNAKSVAGQAREQFYQMKVSWIHLRLFLRRFN